MGLSDRPRMTNTIGASLANARWERLLRGRGRFVANISQPRCLHAAIVRAQEPHGTLLAVENAAALAYPGVVAVFTAVDFQPICKPWRAAHGLFAAAKVPEEFALARDRVRYVGEPVAIVVAECEEAAHTGAEAVVVRLSPLPPLTNPSASLADDAPALHPGLTGVGHPNSHLRLSRGDGAMPHGTRLEVALTLSRVAPQPMETRSITAQYDPVDQTLLVRQSHQHPHQMQDVYSRALGLPEHKVRVICEDVGGAFGMKQQLHTDEMATVCAAVRLGQTVRFVANRSESLIADAQARDHRLCGTVTIDRRARTVMGLSVQDVCGIGAFGQYPRTSFGEAAQANRLFGAPYALGFVQVESDVVFQNRPPLGHYRGVGHPIACLMTEALMDKAARALREDPIALRKRHLIDTCNGPVTTTGGIEVTRFRMVECLDALSVRLAQRSRDAGDGKLRGVGVACLLELIANGSRYYGDGEVNIASTETAVMRMEPSGVVRLAAGHTDQGQGADQAMAQIASGVLGLHPEAIAVISGDSEACPYGGGAFGSRGTVVAGTAVHKAAHVLGQRIIGVAALLNQLEPTELHLADDAVRTAAGVEVMTVADVARISHFKPHLLPAHHQEGLSVVMRHVPEPDAMVAAAACAAMVAIDPDTGVVDVDRVIVAHDSGTMINPAAVDAQITGGVIQGFGQAILEAVRIDDTGHPLTGSFMDYAMPRADNVPAVEIVHLPPLPGEGFAPRGVGEAGASCAPAAIINAVNDALAKRGAEVDTLPAMPSTVWQALRAAAHD